jgi:preprotein translocase subunit SecA
MRDKRRSVWTTEARGTGPYPERLVPEPGPVDRALTTAFARISSRFERSADRLAARVAEVEALGQHFSTIGDDALREIAGELRVALLRHGFRADLVARSFALVREVSHRLLGLRHYPVQLMGGWALTRGMMAEMDTG